MRLLAPLACILAALLSACTDGDPVAGTAAPATAAVSTASAKPDAHAACMRLVGDGGEESLLQRAPEALSDHLTPEMTATDARALARISAEIEAIIEIAPAELAARLRSLQLPFRQAADALEAGGGSVTLDTGAVHDAIVPLMDACVEAGYRIPASTTP